LHLGSLPLPRHNGRVYIPAAPGDGALFWEEWDNNQ
jgi:hypothetical protein